MSRMQYEQPLCRFLKAGVAGGLFFTCEPPSILATVVKVSFDSNSAPIFVQQLGPQDNQLSLRRSTTKVYESKQCDRGIRI